MSSNFQSVSSLVCQNSISLLASNLLLILLICNHTFLRHGCFIIYYVFLLHLTFCLRHLYFSLHSVFFFVHNVFTGVVPSNRLVLIEPVPNSQTGLTIVVQILILLSNLRCLIVGPVMYSIYKTTVHTNSFTLCVLRRWLRWLETTVPKHWMPITCWAIYKLQQLSILRMYSFEISVIKTKSVAFKVWFPIRCKLAVNGQLIDKSIYWTSSCDLSYIGETDVDKKK